MGEEGGLLRRLDRLEAGALAHVAQIEGDAEAVHLGNRACAKLTQAAVLGLEAPVAHEVALVVGELHDPQAEAVEEGQALELVVDGPHVLPAHDEADSARRPRPLDIGRGFDDVPWRARPADAVEQRGDTVAGLDEVGHEVADREVDGSHVAGAQAIDMAVAEEDQPVDDERVLMQRARRVRLRTHGVPNDLIMRNAG